jgi:hypothetical protein
MGTVNARHVAYVLVLRWQVYASPLSGGGRAVALVNRQEEGDAATMSITWERMGYPPDLDTHVTDAFSGRLWSSHAVANLSVTVPPSDVVLLTLQPVAKGLCSDTAQAGAVEAALVDSLRWSADQQRNVECIHVQTLDKWRPWQHGFFSV